MERKSDIRTRLETFISYKRLSKSGFEKQCGLANAYVQNIRQSVTPAKLEKIAKIFPELNTAWLLTGEGEMINAPLPANSMQIDNNNGTLQIGNKLKTDDMTIHELLAQIKVLNEELMRQRQRNDELSDRLFAALERALK